MVENIARLYYETDVISMGTGVLNLSLSHIFAWPKRLLELGNYAFQKLDDYAIDGVCSIDENLPITACCASLLDLPFFWLKEQSLIGGKRQNIRRLMFISFLTPSADDIETIFELFQSQSIELVGIFSFLGFPRPDSAARLISLVDCQDVLAVYRDLHLLSSPEYAHLSTMLIGSNQKPEH